MNSGELWEHSSGAVLIGEKIKDNEWACVHLIKSGENKYMRLTGRVSTRVDPSAYYTGDGIVYEDRIREFYSLVSPETYILEGI